MRHRTEADIADLRRLAGEMAAAEAESGVGYLAANWALHRRIAEITPNKILQHTYVSLLEFVETRLRGVTSDEPTTRHVDGPAVHRELVEAIAAGDPDRLDAAAAAHSRLTAARGGDA
jgi:DNA-binding FadR family transcriptional regulator